MTIINNKYKYYGRKSGHQQLLFLFKVGLWKNKNKKKKTGISYLISLLGNLSRLIGLLSQEAIMTVTVLPTASMWSIFSSAVFEENVEVLS